MSYIRFVLVHDSLKPLDCRASSFHHGSAEQAGLLRI